MIRDEIPDHASILAPNELANHLAGREEYFLITGNPASLLAPAEYALVREPFHHSLPESWRPIKRAGPFVLFQMEAVPE